MRNFPLSRGTVSGILKGYVGLSAAVYTVVYSMVLKGNSANFLLFLTIGIPLVCFLMMYFIRACTPASGEDSSVHVHFIFTQGASVLLAIYLLTTTIVTDVFSLSNAVCYSLVAIMVLLMVSPLVIPVKMTLFPAKKRNVSPSVEGGNSTSESPLLLQQSQSAYLGSFLENDDTSDVQTLLAVGEGAVKEKKRKPKRGEDFKFREALVKADFWLLWVVYFLGVGSGVTVLNNLAQIGVAFGLNDTTMLLALFSFCNFVGRLGSGVVSEHFVRGQVQHQGPYGSQ
ncbi:Protein NUCLEAR FUSION DEFECTIVE 4 [Linum perenne]